MQDNLAQQQNLDQEQHNDWLMRQSPKELKQLAHEPYRIGPLETQQREEFLEKYRTKAVIEQEREAPRRKKVVFEVAPDPNNVELSNRWRNLDQVTRLNISEKLHAVLCARLWLSLM